MVSGSSYICCQQVYIFTADFNKLTAVYTNKKGEKTMRCNDTETKKNTKIFCILSKLFLFKKIIWG